MHFQILWRRQRRAQRPPEQNNYPATPAAYYEGHYPGSAAVKTNRVSFKRALQRNPELNQYPISLTGYYPGSKAADISRTSFKRTLQGLPELNVYPVTVQSSAWGVHFERTRNTTNRRLLSIIELDQYTTTPVAGEPDPSAWVLHFERTNNNTNRKLLTSELNTYPSTPVAYYTGYYPGSALAISQKYSFKRKLQTLELNEYPVISVLPVFVTPLKTTRNRTNRRLQTLPELSVYPGVICTHGLLSLINSRGIGVNSVVSDNGQGVESSITPTQGLLGLIAPRGIGVRSTIVEPGVGVNSDLCE